jgi:hypothetical protein
MNDAENEQITVPLWERRTDIQNNGSFTKDGREFILDIIVQ